MKKVLIKDIGKVITGNTPSKKNEEFYEISDIGFVKPDGIAASGITLVTDTKEYISEKARKKARVVKKGTVLVTCIGSIGKMGIVESVELAFNQQINAIAPNDSVLSKYLAYNILSNKRKLEAIANAPVVPIINKTQFENFEITIHDKIEEQENIVDILDKLTRIIDHKKQQLDEYDHLIKSRFVEMFGDPFLNDRGWASKPLREVVLDDCTISYGIVQTGDNQESGVPVFRPIDIVNNIPTRDSLKKTTDDISNKYKRTILKGRELLITVRANIADTYIIDDEFAGCNVGRGIVPIRTNEDVISLDFLKYQLDNECMKRELKAKAKGITLIQLNMEDLRIWPLIIPDKNLQDSFTDFAQHVDKLKFEVQKSLDENKRLFDSLMQEYFE